MIDPVSDVRVKLKAASDEKTRVSGERFFKENVSLYGVRSAIVGEISKQVYKEISDKDKSYIFRLCEELWKSGIMEESFVACNWSYNVRKQFNEDDIVIFERWINSYVTNWASCDTFCNHTVGDLVVRFPKLITHLKSWTGSQNRWMRRASAVSLIVPARKGLFLNDIKEIASNLLTDTDDMVQKGYGWMLKSASKPHENDIFDFVMQNKARMPRTALRYAIEKMPSELKASAMAK